MSTQHSYKKGNKLFFDCRKSFNENLLDKAMTFNSMQNTLN